MMFGLRKRRKEKVNFQEVHRKGEEVEKKLLMWRGVSQNWGKASQKAKCQ